MAWTYNDWITYSGESRLSRLRSHISEVSAVISEAMSSEVGSVNSQNLVDYVKWLKDQEQGYAAGSSTSSAGFTRGRCV